MQTANHQQELDGAVSDIERTAQAVEDYVRSLAPDTADSLRVAGRSSLGRRVSALPCSDAPGIAAAAANDLPTAIFAYALASAAVAASALRARRIEEAVYSADVAMALIGMPEARVIHAVIDALMDIGIPHTALDPDLEGAVLGARPKGLSSYEIIGSATQVDANDLSLSDFRAKYFAKDWPIVIRGCARNWTACEKWKSPSYLNKLCGSRTVPVELSETSDGSSLQESFMSMSSVLRAMLRTEGNEFGLGKVYLAQHPLFDYIPRLAQDITHPKYVAVGGSEKAELVNVWMGTAGTGTRLHFDSMDNLLVQVVGWKRVTLFAPDQTPNLHVASHGDNFSPVDVENPDKSAHPRFSAAVGETLILGPGDALYLPATHWHFIRALTASISVNFWF